MRARLALLLCAVIASLILLVWSFRSAKHAATSPVSSNSTVPAAQTASNASGSTATNVYAHNLMLRMSPSFRIYVRWLRGKLVRAKANLNPSFDEPDSFTLDIQTGVLRVNVGDLNNYLNASGTTNSPLKNITLSGDGNQIKLNGTLHKIVPLPIEVTGTLATLPNDRVQIHVTKVNVLKIPFKGLLGGFHINISDLFHPQGVTGIQVSGNDILLDPEKLLPAPHMRGQLTNVRFVNPDIEAVYGNAQNDVTRVEQWRNFIRLQNGTLDFGKLTMHHVDLIMIDISNDAWFDLDVIHYQAQLVNGYTRMTPQAGMQIFMPDLSQIPHNKATENISIEWMKNRNAPPPPDVISK